MGLKFEPKSIQEAAEYYKTIHIAPEQKAIVSSLGKMISHALSIEERAIRGFIWRSIKDWQIDHSKDLSSIANMSPENRIQALLQIINVLEKTLMRVLISKEHEPLLEEAMKQVIVAYKQHYANR
ncbi:MAG: hypothetical protein ACFFBP_07585 [Promethearchaeota archaeon]